MGFKGMEGEKRKTSYSNWGGEPLKKLFFLEENNCVGGVG